MAESTRAPRESHFMMSWANLLSLCLPGFFLFGCPRGIHCCIILKSQWVEWDHWRTHGCDWHGAFLLDGLLQLCSTFCLLNSVVLASVNSLQEQSTLLQKHTLPSASAQTVFGKISSWRQNNSGHLPCKHRADSRIWSPKWEVKGGVCFMTQGRPSVLEPCLKKRKECWLWLNSSHFNTKACCFFFRAVDNSELC